MVAMRTTVRLDDDVAAAAERLRRERHIGLGEAVNQLAREGLQRRASDTKPFVQRTASLHARVDVTNIGEVLELIDGPDHK